MSALHHIFLALGTNLGDREGNLRAALQQLPPQVKVTAVSRLYETTPAYVTDQPAFLNIAVAGQTALAPRSLLAYLKGIEASIGREKTIRFGPRKIDLDIIFYDDLVLETSALEIPHPRMAERGFVLRPLADIGAEMQHPVLGKSVRELLAELPEDDGIMTVTDWQPLG